MYSKEGLQVQFSSSEVERYIVREANRRNLSVSDLNDLKQKAKDGTLTTGQMTALMETISVGVFVAMDWS